MDFKVNEIEEYCKEAITEELKHNEDFLDLEVNDIHHMLFNTDYYIIGRYQAREWCEDEAFNIIGFIKDYEMDNFGELYTDLSEPEHVVNMYVYIIGEEILENVIDEVLYEIENNKTKQNKTQKESK